MDWGHFKEHTMASYLVPGIPIIFMVEKCVHFYIRNKNEVTVAL